MLISPNICQLSFSFLFVFTLQTTVEITGFLNKQKHNLDSKILVWNSNLETDEFLLERSKINRAHIRELIEEEGEHRHGMEK